MGAPAVRNAEEAFQQLQLEGKVRNFGQTRARWQAPRVEGSDEAYDQLREEGKVRSFGVTRTQWRASQLGPAAVKQKEEEGAAHRMVPAAVGASAEPPGAAATPTGAAAANGASAAAAEVDEPPRSPSPAPADSSEPAVSNGTAAGPTLAWAKLAYRWLHSGQTVRIEFSATCVPANLHAHEAF